MRMVFFLFFLFLPISSYAEDYCINVDNSIQSYYCSIQKKNKSTLLLKKKYDLYINEVKKNYSSDMKIGNELLVKIEDSQRKWSSYMNIMCDIYSFQIESGNRSHETAVNNCISDMSDKREIEISNMINNI